MRIAHLGIEIVPSENGAFVGGLVKNVATVSAAQVQQGHDTHIFTTDVHGRLTDGARMPYGRVHRIRTVGEYGSMPFAATFLTRASREVRRANRGAPFDLLHVHSAYASLGAISYPLRKLGIPMVFSLYSPNFRARPGHDCNGRRSVGPRMLARRSLAAFGSTIVPSANLNSRVVELGIPEHRVCQIPPAVDPTMFVPLMSREEARRKLGLPDDVPILLFVGNYSPWKGVEILLRAMADIRSSHPDAVLVTAWGEPYEWEGNRRDAVLGLIDSLGLTPSIRQVGIVEDIRTLLRAADVLVSPFECTCKVLDYPLSILEALACERPVVSTSVGGIPEILDGGTRGLLVAPHDPQPLAAAVNALLDDPQRAQAVGLSGAAWVQERCRPDTVVASLESLYLKLRGGHGMRRTHGIPHPN